jgi:hypothetical protein
MVGHSYDRGRADRSHTTGPLPRSAAFAAPCLLAFEPAAAGGSELVAPLTAVIRAHDLSETMSAELEHLAIQALKLIEERSAFRAEARLEVSCLAMRDEADDGLARHPLSPSSGRRV